MEAEYSSWTHCGLIMIVDLNKEGRRSVTHDAEKVVRAVVDMYGNRPIYYRDSMGVFDELEHNDGEFTGFRRISYCNGLSHWHLFR